MLASSTSSIVFQSPARSPCDGRGIGDGDAAGHLRERGPAPRPRRRGAPAAAAAGAAPGTAPGRRLRRRRRRRDAQLSAAGRPQPFARRLVALRVERDAIGAEVALGQRHEDALQPAVGRLLGAQQDAGLAARGAAERREERDVLIGAVEQQPAAAGFGGADDLAVLGAPLGLARAAASRSGSNR